jgi:enoyl-CoA hydratase
VNRVVPAAELIPAATAMVTQMLANGPLALALAIEAVDRGLETSLEEGLALEASHFAVLAATADAGEGTRAFLDKRAARFGGR